MDFALSEEQELFRKTIRLWVDENLPKSYANELERQEGDFPHEVWDLLTDAGLHAVGIDEEYGGQGGDIVILARSSVAEMMGLPRSF